MRTDLIGPTGDWARFDQRGSIITIMKDGEFRPGGQTGFVIDFASACSSGFGADRRFANEKLLGRAPFNARDILLFNRASGKLRLQQ